ncbi:unnamed protein product [Ilex paraguariensis]|uniref:Uncharacterized protein n=1 Tax=Ilex paraguariensis TaxID=185542 RepID=A0ABC8S3L8_9AQUA
MPPELLHAHQSHHHYHLPPPPPPPRVLSGFHFTSNNQTVTVVGLKNGLSSFRRPTEPPLRCKRWRTSTAFPRRRLCSISASFAPLDLTEDNVNRVLADARVELGQLFDTSIGMTGVAELAELDGPYVKISLKGRFWHKRSDVLARLGNYLKQKIPEILEVEIEDERQLDDSPENF